MSKTVLDVTTRALRMLKVVGLGRAPSASMASDGVSSLQALFMQLVETEAFGPLSCVLLTADYTAGENESLSGSYAVTLPTTITDPCAIDPRAPKDRAIVAVSANVTTVDGAAVTTPQVWLYDACQAAWVALHGLVSSAACPLADRYFDGLSAMLAVYIADEYEAEITAAIVETARRGRRAMTRKDPMPALPVAIPLLCTSNRRLRI